MKKLLSTLLCLSVITGIIPMTAGATTEPIYIEDGAESWSKTVISGDINDDGKLSIADAVILQQCLMNTYSPDDDFELDEAKLDVNFDGNFDVFDLVQIRQTVLHPETAPTQTWAIDVFKSASIWEAPEDPEDFYLFTPMYESIFFTTQKELSAYLSILTVDNTEIQKYLDRYDEAFFEENNLILEPFVQDYGNGVFHEIFGTARLNNTPLRNETFDGIIFSINSTYEHDEGLYPQNKTNLLAQVTVPKSQSSADDNIAYINGSHFFSTQYESCYYTSPDGQHEVVFTQRSGLHHGFIDAYLKNPDGSFLYIGDIFNNDNYFENNGELSGDNYNITFYDDYVVIDYIFDGNCKKLWASYDGTDIQDFSYGENHTYKSPDGQTELYITQEYHYLNDVSENFINVYVKKPNGCFKKLCDFTALNGCMPFSEDGEWSVDEDGNNVFGNGSTYSITWLDDSVIIDHQIDGDHWEKGQIPLDGSAVTDISKYWK